MNDRGVVSNSKLSDRCSINWHFSELSHDFVGFSRRPSEGRWWIERQTKSAVIPAHCSSGADRSCLHLLSVPLPPVLGSSVIAASAPVDCSEFFYTSIEP